MTMSEMHLNNQKVALIAQYTLNADAECNDA